MSSIRRRITIRILIGLALLWIVASVGIFLSVRHSLLKSIDAELAVDARLVRFAARPDSEEPREGGGRRLQDRMPAYDDPDGDAFFQLWSINGEPTEKSLSLGENEFPFPGPETSPEPVFANHQLEDGRQLRTMTFRLSSGGKGKGRSKGRAGSNATVLVLAQGTEAMRATLISMLGGISLIGIGVAAVAILLVRFGVEKGLTPLNRLGEETARINAERLHERFDSTDAPAELQPVYRHFNDLIERLETSFNRERRFNADLAHELRTPVAELKMLNEVALKWEDQAGEKTHQESLAIAGQLENTIETLLKLARFESGEVSPKSETIDVNNLLEECWSTHFRSASERSLSVAFAIPDRTVLLQADPSFLKPILNNLISNAIAYAPENSTIEISAEKDLITITNEAPHLEATDLENLFERYWRKDSARTGSSHVGLGLSLSIACAKLLGLALVPSLKEGSLHMEIRPETVE